MNPIEKIRDGIQKGDWAAVTSGFNKMTGERLSPPAMNDKSMVIDALGKLIGELTGDIQVATKPKKPRGRPKKVEPLEEEEEGEPLPVEGLEVKSQMKSPARSLPFSKPDGPNRFKPDSGIGSGDIKIDQRLTAGLEPTPRRPPPRKVLTPCNLCNREYSVYPSELTPSLDEDGSYRYVCPKCEGNRP